MVVGAIAEVLVSIDDEGTMTGRLKIERAEVRSADPIELPDIVIDKPAQKVAAPARAVPANALASFIPVPPGRPALEKVLRDIGRDAVTPEMVDRAWLLTRPQFYWHANFAEVRENLADADFRPLIDQAARARYGKPADALAVFCGALYFRREPRRRGDEGRASENGGRRCGAGYSSARNGRRREFGKTNRGGGRLFGRQRSRTPTDRGRSNFTQKSRGRGASSGLRRKAMRFASIRFPPELAGLAKLASCLRASCRSSGKLSAPINGRLRMRSSV